MKVMIIKPEITVVMGIVMVGTAVHQSSRYYSSSSWRENDCYKEVGRGLRLESSHVDKFVKAGSLSECERACDIAFFACKSFAYSDYHTSEPENCLLSREDTHSLDIDDPRDFYSDRDFIYYQQTSGRDCDYEAEHHGHYPSGKLCYELVKTRMRINARYIIRGKVLRTKNRQECEAECDRERECLGFNYRFKTLGYNQYRDNCELSSRDASDRTAFEFDDDFDFYEQVADSRGCRDSGSSWGSSSNYYSGGYSGSNTGGSFGSSWGGGGYGDRDECFRLALTETALESRVIRESFEARDIRDCEDQCTRARFYTCRAFAFRYSVTIGRDRDNCFLTDLEYREMSNYDLVQDRSFDFYERRLYDRECGYDTGYHEDAGDMTVSGVRCYHDRCREDRQAGYFYCETDFAGAWDYCCRPREVCGYSEGYDVKWCYVGIEGRDQWRPCTGQGPGREYLKEETPNFNALVTSSGVENSTLEVLDLNDIA